MNRFWSAFKRGRVAAVGTMGEPVAFEGREGSGIVTDMREAGRLVPGGESKGLKFEVEVSLEYGAAVSDGERAEVRGEIGRVDAKRPTGGGWIIEVGPVNRWTGD